jgi:orotate phosphoribosyltransferase
MQLAVDLDAATASVLLRIVRLLGGGYKDYDEIKVGSNMRRRVENYRELLRAEIEREAIHFGRITLTSGAISDYYINCRQVTLSPKGAWLAANAVLDSLAEFEVDAVGGMTLAADPIVASVALESWHRGKPTRAFIVRKEAKVHGLQKQVEGPIVAGDRVAIVDDVLTTGGSILQAIAAVETIPARVVAIVVLLDRLQGGRQAIEERGYPVRSILTFEDVRPFIDAHRTPANSRDTG